MSSGRQPIVIGVAGGSGSGKTTVVRQIVESLGPDEVIVLEHDRYYRPRERSAARGARGAQLRSPGLARDRSARPPPARIPRRTGVDLPVYDFARYTRLSLPERVEPRRAIIVEGILIFTDAELRRLMDVKVFVDTDADTASSAGWSATSADRGRTVQSVIDQYLGTVKPMHLDFVEPSKRYADIIVPQGGHNTVAIDMLLTLIRALAARSGAGNASERSE